MSWYARGEDAEKRAQKAQEEREKQYGPRRFWLKPGNSAKVTFLDSDGFGFYEHNLFINGRWGNFYTCRKDFDECPLCEELGNTPSYVVAWTIIDHSKYTSEKTGKVYQHTKKLLVAKQSVQTKLFRRKRSLDGDLTYAVFTFHRDKREECNTGEDIEFIKKFTKEELLKIKPDDVSEEEWLKPFDYMEIFKPKPVDELRKLTGHAPPVGSEEDDDLPFDAADEKDPLDDLL